MKVVKAKIEDKKAILDVYKNATFHMKSEKNLTQRTDSPDEFFNKLIKYIQDEVFYLVVRNDEVIGFFTIIYGIDKSYNDIKGKWTNDLPYVTVHKIASKYYREKIGTFMLSYIMKQAISNMVYNIRIDTHKDNVSMNNFLLNNDFVYCGVISYTCDFNDKSSHRNAYIKELSSH